MIQLATQLRKLGVETPPRAFTPPITPEQKLLQTILATTIRECASYSKTGKISHCCPKESKTLFVDNIRTLRLIDTQYLMAAGFEKHKPILKMVRDVVKSWQPENKKSKRQRRNN